MRAPPLLLLLLMAAAGLAVSPLAHINPWLSACDLEEEAGGERECGGTACSGGGERVERLERANVTNICGTTAGKRAEALRNLRLRACCERSPASALDPVTRAKVQAGGPNCERTLFDLISLDAMVSRVHCDFVDILSRYDCEQSYSVHTCNECQETYRRWACSTMVPLWAEERPVDGSEESERTRRAPAEHAARWRARHLERVGHLDRRRGGGVVGRWVRAAAAGPGRPLRRIKPCLSVCQLVEQHCPFFLPADRAPAYPTQYAGEPTFLCLDPRIPETGAQANKSNYGTDDCCYYYRKNNDTEPNCDGKLCQKCSMELTEQPRPQTEECPAVEERVPTCSSPYLQPAGAPRSSPPLVALLVLALPLALFALSRTHWTASTPLVNVRDSRL